MARHPSAQAPRPAPGFLHALIAFGGVLGTMGTGLFLSSISIHAILFLCLCWLLANVRWLGVSYTEARLMMSRGIGEALPAIYIFLLIGMVIASFMMSGTVAALIVWGIDWITPGTFLLTCFVATSLMSVATGTAWGTVGTLGVVMMGIAASVDASLPMVAGAVISGATFGDKLSPVSDTTNLAAISAGTDLYRHIGSMLYTTVPTALLVLVLLGVADSSGSGQWDLTRAGSVRMALVSHYQLNLLVGLGPIVVLFGLALARFPAELAMGAGIVSAGVLAVTFQDVTLVDVLNGLWQNQQGETGHAEIDALLGRGGMYAMAWTLMLALMALALGGLLKEAGFLVALLGGLADRIRRTATLVTSTIGCGLLGNAALGEAYVSIILNCQLFRDAFERKGIDRAVLSRSVEEGATLTTGLIPWTTAGAFYAATLGVATLEYAPYAFLNYLNGLVAITMASLGIGLLRGKKKGGPRAAL
jgi:NhaC family Na+:H+ antiporter